MLNWLEIAFSLNNPMDFAAFNVECNNKKVTHKLTEIDYKGRIIGTIRMMEEFGYADPQSAYDNIHKLKRGFGDSIAAFTHAIGIKPCGGCQRRRETCNRFLPYVKERQ